MAVACGLSLGDGHCTFDNPYPDERPHYRQPRCYRKPHRHSVWPKTNALTRKGGQRRMRQAVAREGGDAKRNPKLARERVIENRTASVTVFICETEIPFGPQMSGGSDNAMSSARANVFDMAWWPNGMEVRCLAAFAHVGCRWVTATARSTTPTLTNIRIPVSPSTDDPRTAIPFGRKRMR